MELCFFLILKLYFLNRFHVFYIYQKLVDLSPNEGFSKYMCLAQLSSGIEAVHFYEKGIELILIEFEKQSNTPNTSTIAKDLDEEENEITKSNISTAYGSVAEIYLTDLW